MTDTDFIVYKYTFSDGMVYIGRTRNDQKRLGNMNSYRGQYVGKMMCKMPNFETEILYTTGNPFIAYHIESVAIKHY